MPVAVVYKLNICFNFIIKLKLWILIWAYEMQFVHKVNVPIVTQYHHLNMLLKWYKKSGILTTLVTQGSFPRATVPLADHFHKP